MAIDLNRLSSPSFFIHKSPETAYQGKEIFKMEQRAISQMEKSQKMTKAEEKYRQAQAVYDQAVKDEKEEFRTVTST